MTNKTPYRQSDWRTDVRTNDMYIGTICGVCFKRIMFVSGIKYSIRFYSIRLANDSMQYNIKSPIGKPTIHPTNRPDSSTFVCPQKVDCMLDFLRSSVHPSVCHSVRPFIRVFAKCVAVVYLMEIYVSEIGKFKHFVFINKQTTKNAYK